MDYDQDGHLDIYLTTAFAADKTVDQLWRNQGNGSFNRVLADVFNRVYTAAFGCWADYPAGVGGANNWFDFDNDGYLDSFNIAYLWNRRCMMRNNRDGTFTEVNLGDLTGGPTGWLAGCADYDNDGFIDVVVPSGGVSNKPNDLYHNEGNENHWVLVKLVGTLSNRSAIGAKVRAQATMWGQDVQPGVGEAVRGAWSRGCCKARPDGWVVARTGMGIP